MNDTPKKYTYIEIIELSTRKCIKRLDVTGNNERQIEKIERGLLRNMNREDYSTQTRSYKQSQPLSA